MSTVRPLSPGKSRDGRERPAAPRQHKSRSERRAEIVAATLAILAEDGLHAWTTSALARRVGVSEATLFRHFSSKEEILSAALKYQIQTLARRVVGFRNSGDAWEQLQGLVLDVVAFMEDSGGGPLLILSGQATRISADSRREAEATRELLRRRLAELFQQASCVGNERLPRPELLADMAIAIIHSTGLRWLISGRTFPMRREAAAMLRVLRRCVEA